MTYDVFISYRRDFGRGGVGASMASLVKRHLQDAGLKVFFDLDSLHAGNFPVQLEEAISNSRNVVLILSPGALDRCDDAEDWVRKEIESAVCKSIPVTPVFHPEFIKPPCLPSPLQSTLQNNGLMWIHEYENAAVQKLLGLLGKDRTDLFDRGNNTGETGGNLVLQCSEGVFSKLKALVPTTAEVASGYQVVDCGGDIVLKSDVVDAAVRSASADLIRWVESSDSTKELEAALGAQGQEVERILLQRRRERGDNFRNEEKIGLATDILLEMRTGALPAEVRVFHTDFYSSFRTNELATLDVYEESDAGNERIWAGADHFPWDLAPSGVPTMKPLWEKGFSNHIGGNTIGVTSDGMLVIWIQSRNAEKSRNCWAPTGSGSLDWSDLDPAGSFLETIANGTTRELREECGIPDKSIEIQTKVIGFYRWCSRGGLPGFLSVSKIGLSFQALHPEPAEVCFAKGRPFLSVYPAMTPDALANSVGRLLDNNFDSEHRLSTPLRVNLLALEKALLDDAKPLDFLFA